MLSTKNVIHFRGEMNENLNRLSDRINHLENVVTNLTESLPELARQLGSEIRQGTLSAPLSLRGVFVSCMQL